jgi:arylsulfatase A-like enzyme
MCDEPVIGTDFYPTFLDLAGSPPPEKHPLDGVSLVDLWRGKTHTLKREALFWHTPSYWHKCQPSSVILKGNFKLIEWFEDNRVEMFDLATDPGEMTNLSDSHPEKLAELHGQLKEWREQIGAPIPTKMNPDYEPEG